MSRRALQIPLPDGPVDAVGALLDLPERTASPFACLLAHGAGVDLDAAFLEAVATGLSARGLPVLRFRYPYRERMARSGGRLPPDRLPALESAHRAALERLRAELPEARPLLAGKSLGARVSTLLAAEGVESAGLVLLGYPLHPAGRPERLRSEHFPRLSTPLLFFQGTRDRLCDLELLERELPRLAGPARVVVVDEADHGFEVTRRSGRAREEVWAEMADEIVAWAGELG